MQTPEKQLVRDFFESSFYKDSSLIKKFLHPEVSFHWNSSTGFSILNLEELTNISLEMGKAYEAITCEISHLLQEKNMITIRFSYLVNTIENPEEEFTLAHFVCIWEIKDQKLYKGYLMSQPNNDSQ
jgi:hypothetical protein